MRKISVALIAVLVLSLIMGSLTFAQETEYDYDTLVDWDIKIASPEGTMAVLEGNQYYIYPMGDGIPYVMVITYTGFEGDEEDFLAEFTEYMSENYPDLEVVMEPQVVDIDGINYYATEYSYTVQGYEVDDTRVIRILNDRVYMFASKEIEELDLMVGDLLEEVIAASVFLKDGVPVDIITEPEDDIPELYWDDQNIEYLEEEGITGEFITLEDVGLEIFMISDLKPTPLPEEQPERDSYLGFYTTDMDYSAYVLIQFIETALTIDEYRDLVESIEETDNVLRFRINGLDFVTYSMPDSKLMCLSTMVEDKGLVEFSFYPSDDSDFVEIAEIIGSSIRPVKD